MLGAGSPEEVRLAARREHEVVSVDGPAVAECYRPCIRVGRAHVGLHHLDRVVMLVQLAEVVLDIDAGELEGRHLIEQRQELVIVVPVDQRDPRMVWVLRQLVRTPEPGEPAPDDDDVRLLHHHDPSFTEMPQRPRHDPPGSSRMTSVPVRNALAGHVIGSIATPCRRRSTGSSVSPV